MYICMYYVIQEELKERGLEFDREQGVEYTGEMNEESKTEADTLKFQK